MRLFTKIFFSVIMVFCLTFLVSGYFILSFSLKSCVEREKEFALQQYKYDKFTAQAAMISGRLFEETEDFARMQPLFETMARQIDADICLVSAEGECLYTEGPWDDLPKSLSLSADHYWFQFLHQENQSHVLIGSLIRQDDVSFGFLTKTNISESIRQQKRLQTYFERCFCAALILGIVLMLGLSLLLTRPLSRMTKAADRIADGCYHERLRLHSKDELGQFADSFNRMTAMVEQTIQELSEEAEKKEDFVANFAHELKTPLTSIIGYADMIYQKDLPREKVKKAAWYIWNEGMRLEALSLKLMDLTNLNRQEFPRSAMSAEEILADVMEGAAVALRQKGVQIFWRTEDVYIIVDYDLIKTMLLNLIDNAVKADCRRIRIEGKTEEGKYQIRITDDGKGIPAAQLSKITEAFYMVDKASARKQHGAGIGLALVRRIVELHEGKLRIDSREGEGTCVTVALPLAEAEEDPEEEGLCEA